MKDLGNLTYFLGLKVAFDGSAYFLSQAKYAIDLLSQACLIDT